MSASSSSRATYPASHTDTPSSCNYAAYPMHDEEGTHYYYDESESGSENGAPDFYDMYQRQRHDHYVALLGPILRGEASTANGDKDNQDSDAINSNNESDDVNLSDAHASYKEDTVALGKRPRTDGSIVSSAKRARVDVATEHGSGELTTEGASTSQPAPTDRVHIILSTIPEAKRTRAHLEAFYTSLQPGPRQLQLLGKQKSKILSKQEREEYLKADEWIKEGSVQRWEVVCAGCDRHITLEKPRSDAQMEKGGCEFYPGNWNKHRNGCAGVYRKWCEQNGLEADEGMGRPKESGKKKAKKAGNEKVKGTREVKPLPTRATARRASLASIPVNVIA
ncbi:hypothetical protein BDZ89DRAFT_1140536 [Hymenopellis radicata]|nr:hypothetical protein BDZ89DRAFT_1140536 [Hymenopellis radicata]